MHEDVEWSHFAYSAYVTDEFYLCNAVMLFASLERLGSKAERVMMYPRDMHYDVTEKDKTSELLLKAREEYRVRLEPVDVIKNTKDSSVWADSFTKLLAFNQTRYKRVLNLDTDGMILQPLDDLFFLPSSPVAMPRAYWESDDKLADPLILVEPSPFEFDRILKAIKSADPQVYDMDIVSKMHHGSALVMPHRRLVLLTGELRRADDDHSAYLGNDIEKWDVDEVIKEAKYIHFSDWPVPKPWAVVPKPVIEQDAPACRETTPGVNDNCHQRDIWIGFYEDYAFRRKAVCDVDAEYLEKWGSTSDVFRAPF